MSEASEILLGVVNAKSGIGNMYICMYGWYVCPLNACAQNFFLQKTRLFRLDPVYTETTALSKPYFKLKLRSLSKFLRKLLFFKTQKVASTDPFPDLISKLRHCRGGGIRSADCWLSRAIGIQNALILMLRKLLLLEGS